MVVTYKLHFYLDIVTDTHSLPHCNKTIEKQTDRCKNTELFEMRTKETNRKKKIHTDLLFFFVQFYWNSQNWIQHRSNTHLNYNGSSNNRIINSADHRQRPNETTVTCSKLKIYLFLLIFMCVISFQLRLCTFRFLRAKLCYVWLTFWIQIIHFIT